MASLIDRIYFALKPVIPWQLRISLRRLRASHQRRVFANVWPIDENAGRVPCNWPGWPEGKSFAVALSHDVEGNKGLARVEQLMELEMKHGFHSCFNFVPEGEYEVPDALRAMLSEAEFEVGVHGLQHDGKLYNSRARFAKAAVRIREYLQHWNAAGFRSPLMQHRLAWLHAVNATYDSSTFDTDPFEPEPDGVGTIFPFWVPDGHGGGYVELPYTLIQDFNLFVVLREPNIGTWKRKLDWVAEHGGMVLLNTHPDYMCFAGTPLRDEYLVSRYEELLHYLKDKYEGRYWNAQPREIARYYKEKVPLACRNTRKKICMLGYTFYESDNRVRRYAETLAKRGDQIDVIALSGTHSQKAMEQIKGVTVYRVQHRRYDEVNKWVFAWRLMRFLLTSSACLTWLHRRNRYDVIHIHNMPDFLVFAAWYPKLAGAKLILDIHDIVPELFSNKFETSLKGGYVSVLKVIEKLSAAFVNHVIISNHLWREKLVQRSVPEANCSVFVNHVDSDIFFPRSKVRQDNRFIVLFPGSLHWHQGVDIALKAFVRVKQRMPNAEFHVYGGGGDQQADLAALAQQLGLDGSVKFFRPVSLEEIPQVIANADLGVVPKRADSFGNEAYSTKIMEFMSQGVPVVASRTKIDTFYFDETTVHFFKSGDSQAMADAMLEVIDDAELRRTMIVRGHEYVARNCWLQRKQEYLDLIDSLSTERFDDFTVPHPGREFATPAPLATIGIAAKVPNSHPRE